jgi:PPM family protein phosphatase
MITIIGATHPGARDHNEDCFAADTERGIGLVADGMGGYACGEVASELVKQTVVQALRNNEGLKEAIARAHSVVKNAADNDAEKRGMGSTVIALKVRGAEYEIAWVGDSRAYLWDGELKQISRDHSYVENLIASGAISAEEAIDHPNRNLITQAVGVAGATGLEISVVHGRLTANQQLLLCSDGLVDEVVDKDIARLLSEAGDQKEAVNSLIQAAVDAGGHDNITVLIAAANNSEIGKEAKVPNSIRTTRLNNIEGGAGIGRNDYSQRKAGSEHGQTATPYLRKFAAHRNVSKLIDFFRFYNQLFLGSIIAVFAIAGLLLYLA